MSNSMKFTLSYVGILVILFLTSSPLIFLRSGKFITVQGLLGFIVLLPIGAIFIFKITGDWKMIKQEIKSIFGF